MIRITMLTLVVLLCGKANAQGENLNSSAEQKNTTTLLLVELQNKVQELQKLKEKLSANTWSTPQEKEMTIIQIDDAFNDIKVFVYNSLEESCRLENRLMEISNTVRSIDPKMAVKYALMSEELQSNHK